jgi:3-deoxy-manno-octulosonate cytidylyltransferase (CMP-KDO synthetase)
MKFLVLIPARYESSRFPGKPLAKIGGVEMIIRVCRQVAKTGFDLAVATDNQQIYDCVEQNGFKAVMTSSDHHSGTERIEEAYCNLNSDADVVINVQGDEPFIRPEQISLLASIFEKYPDTNIATLAKKFNPEEGFDALFSPNLVKVTFNKDKEALYFSRSIIPYVRRVDWKQWLSAEEFFTHIGIYAYRAETLKKVVAMPESTLERAESLEQLRWLQNGLKIRLEVSEHTTIGIDTPEDLAKAEKFCEDFCAD